MSYKHDIKRKTVKYSQYTDKKGLIHKVIHSVTEKKADTLNDINYIYAEINYVHETNSKDGEFK